ncbi:hypothetical protein ABZ135_36610 [Streptomyces sp. NPDC006339]|uniref:hypothetical protein n=1 Tax=Streptomyces sp. NPDC006339 TaxID=3156755 RepID=UPI0033B717A9
MRRHATTALAGALLALTACSSTNDAPAPTPTASSSTAKAYTYQDCIELLDYDFQQGKPQDASKDAECAHLPRDQYEKAVAEVLTKHKDSFLNPTSTP